METRAKPSPVRHQATTAQVGHKGVNPFTKDLVFQQLRIAFAFVELFGQESNQVREHGEHVC